MRIFFSLISIILFCFIGINSFSQIEVYKAKTLTLDKPAKEVKLNKTKISDSALTSLSFFVGRWKCGVNGAVYEIKDINNDLSKLKTSAGSAKTKPLYIFNDGTYYWESYGEKKKGKWEKTKRKDYPIVLLNAIEKKDWLIGRDPYGANIINIWDGVYYSYTATPF